MTQSPIHDQGPRDIDSATIDELEKMLGDAEHNIHLIREELKERRAEQRHEQIQALPNDISAFEGSWRNIIKILRDVIREERAARAETGADSTANADGTPIEGDDRNPAQ
ncbi:hypothetical protein [uncultured Corynebacterium sp.]|uniref:hypothetical protein n=1 Tax=uncultured Corynebacterium sp. TaxID=159447 RepID=UPI0025FE799A|nr:hypothetical protein [uncultured Corynebacterium sp.]